MALFTGTIGNDNFTGTYLGDTFDLIQGGSDTAKGGLGGDAFNMGATLDATDKLEGGGGNDVISLDGDYSAGLLLGATTLADIEGIYLLPGDDYTLALRDQNNTQPFVFGIFGYSLLAGDVLTFDGSRETSHPFSIYDGAGDDVLTGGGGNDQFNLNVGGRDFAWGMGGSDTFHFNAAWAPNERIDGGDGFDYVYLTGEYREKLGANSFRSIETLSLNGAFSYKLTMHDGNVGADNILQIQGYGIGAAHRISINGAAELDGRFHIQGGAGRDALTGGARADTLNGREGADTLVGGDGEDELVGGIGHDELTGGSGQDFFAFDDGDSPFANPDLILDLQLSDVVSLFQIDADSTQAFDQPFTLVASFGGNAGELVVDYDSGTNITSFLMDTDGDSAADGVIEAVGNRSSFVQFEL